MGNTGAEHGAVLERVVRTEPLVAGGMSGSSLERGWLDDDSRVAELLGATGDDEPVRHRERDGLDWWTVQVRKALTLMR